MTHDNPYDQREADWQTEDLRQRRADEADEAFNERRQLGPVDDLTNNETRGE